MANAQNSRKNVKAPLSSDNEETFQEVEKSAKQAKQDQQQAAAKGKTAGNKKSGKQPTRVTQLTETRKRIDW